LANRESTGVEKGINARTTVSLTDGTVLDIPFTFRLKATANGGGSIFKEVTFRITVCGDESIIAPDGDKTQNQYWNSSLSLYQFYVSISQADTPLLVPMSDFLESTDRYCPILDYTLRQFGSNTDLTTPQAANTEIVTIRNIKYL